MRIEVVALDDLRHGGRHVPVHVLPPFEPLAELARGDRGRLDLEAPDTVGPVERLSVTRICCGTPTWCGAPPRNELVGLAQVRAHAEPIECRAVVSDGRLEVELTAPLAGVAAGQTLVLYDDDRVVGSATIEAAR